MNDKQKERYVFLPEKYPLYGRIISWSVLIMFIIFLIISIYAVHDAFGVMITILFIGIALFIITIVFLLLYAFIEKLIKKTQSAEDIINLLRESKERYALAVSGASEGLWDFNLKTGKAYFSEFWKSILGYTEGDIIDTIDFWRDSIHKDDREGVQQSLKNYIGKQTPYYSAEYRIKTKSGTYKWFFDKGRAIWDKDGNAIRIAGSSSDISNIKKVEEVLKSKTEELENARQKIENEVNNTRKFKQAVESSSDAISIMTPAGSIIYANPAWEDLSGYSYENVQGSQFADWYEKDTEPDIIKDMWATLKLGKPFTSDDLIGRRKDGTTYQVEISLFPIMRNGKRIFYTAIQQDITKRKEIDKAKTEFVSLASHQLRTPLSAVRWYAEMLLSGDAGNLDDKQNKYLGEIYSANKRMIELVGSLLNVSRIDLGTFGINPKETDLRKLFDTTLLELKPLIRERKIIIEKEYPESMQNAFIDPLLIRNVFQNLISNSIKYTPEGGKVEINLKEEDTFIRFSVSDTGYGIPEYQQDKIFTKLFRADNVREHDTSGTGLGLYIVKAIMEKSGGKIWFESPVKGRENEENKGTIFYGIIPIKGNVQKSGVELIGAKHINNIKE